MKTNGWMLRCCALGLAFGSSVLLAGCATQPSSKSSSSYQLSDLEGTWSWVQQGPWHGDFVLKKEGDTCMGTLDDVYEGTYGDQITDVTLVGKRIKFTRTGQYGVQHWEGTLKRTRGVLKIVDGRWEKVGRSSGAFTAERKSADTTPVSTPK